MNKIICIGNATWDQTFSVKSPQVKGTRLYADKFSVNGGGIAATAAVAIADCGGDVNFIGRMGQDKVGDQIYSDLISHGVNMDFSLKYEKTQSSIATIILSDDHSSQIYVYNDPNMPKETASLFELDLSEVTAIVADLTWYEGVKVLFERAKQLGIPTFLRVSFYNATIIDLLELADYPIYSHPSLLAMTSDINLKRALVKAKKRVGGNPVVTLSNRGCAWLEDEIHTELKAIEVDVLDTTGAGDIFVGLLALFISNGNTFKHAIETATQISALSCTFMGARQLSNCPAVLELIE